MRFLFCITALFASSCLANPVTAAAPAAPLAPPSEPEQPIAMPAVVTSATSMFWLDYTKTWDPLQATITPPPGQVDTGGRGPINYIQTTYFSCVTRGSYEHCGWHIPILFAASWHLDGMQAAVRAGVAAGIVGALVALA